VQELAVAVELGLTLPIIIWDNGKLGEIEDSMVRSQIAPNAVVARNPDFLALAKAYGAGAVQPDSLEALQQAVLAAFNADTPSVIRVTPDIAG
jgi:acetolactate synthase-1/2/3 large subunit/5-guanidino-2-oxopentanoate decarboxylase